ncbi:MAG: hypothetical protein V3V49_09795 [Candidatus Krumholzibacteria bacterium]
MRAIVTLCLIVCLGICAPWAVASESATGELPKYLRDRGPGVPTSMFGTYVLPGELLVYPFVEYYQDLDAEYSPAELGFGLDEDFRGDYEATEYLVFLGYGLGQSFALEFEAAVYITAEQEKAPNDPTALPDELSESGLGDVQMQVNWLWQRETSSRPALFSYGEVVFPFQKDKRIIGTQDWEYKLGTGVIRGFGFGTMTFRAALEYDRAEGKFEMGEFALEYLRRISPLLRVFTGIEGTEDEWELITEAQIHLTGSMFIKLNSAFGITSKAEDWAPETGVVFRF